MPGARYVDRRPVGRLADPREVEVVHGRSHGWIDLLAFDPRTGRLVVEIKTRLDDVGAIERQLGWYRRMAPAIARAQGWEVRQTTGWPRCWRATRWTQRSRQTGRSSDGPFRRARLHCLTRAHGPASRWSIPSAAAGSGSSELEPMADGRAPYRDRADAVCWFAAR